MSALCGIDVVAEMETAFDLYSRGLVAVPPVGELLFEQPPGEMHIKYGAIGGDSVFVIKIATGFYENTTIGLPSSGGVVLVFSARTGALVAILQDEGHLTDIRTAAAGAVAAKWLMPDDLQCIGICGSGSQARLQAQYLREVTSCRTLVVWARNAEKAARCAADIAALGYDARAVASPRELAALAGLIVTTTASRDPFLMAPYIRPGTHIVAMGTDTPEKSEIDAAVLGRATCVVADSRSQCFERGEIHHAIAQGLISPERIVELGEIIAAQGLERRANDAITVVDLTGVAVQDIVLAKAVCAKLGLVV
ncbi:MAG: ornithine cyclodeaminase family protein [Mesorhizobium sp.]|uniref:ornithine cyclodeaminase family protein n=1 Tax=Mesorhizobium sp. TaxID=1871066 RepID=UPI001AC65E4B|nr:ornithine cyclodeaminase family protein [Mesorhizobium sp.]MBN9217292.1 ornithine cyclodeaminase family protein [Mesorhizobium sp.]